MIQTDALIIGAGPVGLFQVFELGLQDIHAQVIDVLPHVGGQCIELYADKPIYDIPGLPRCTGRELIERLSAQASPFAPTYHLGQQVTDIQRQADERLLVRTSTDQLFLTRTLFIASGVGAFLPRQLPVPGLDDALGAQVFYQPRWEASVQGQHISIAGSETTAVESALRLSRLPHDQAPASVTLIHRRQTLDVDEALAASFNLACEGASSPCKVSFCVGQITGFHRNESRLTHLDIATPEGGTISQDCDQLWVLLGLSPRLGPITQWGLALERKQLIVDTERFQTSEMGIYAVGDSNTYPGKRKLILSGFHEATLAAFAAAAYLNPGQKIPLQYTTASPRLHALLQVKQT